MLLLFFVNVALHPNSTLDKKIPKQKQHSVGISHPIGGIRSTKLGYRMIQVIIVLI